MNETIRKNYKKSLEQKYNAVCLDIDGTLTQENSKHIDQRAIEMLADLLRRRVPIVFITGRGETGLNDMLKDIVPVLKEKYKISHAQLARMYALVNDGARLFWTAGKGEKLFNEEKYLASPEARQSLTAVDCTIKEKLLNTSLANYCEISYSKDMKSGEIVNIRLNCLNDDRKINEQIFKIINNLITSYDNLLNVTMGIYGGKLKIQIGTTKKDKAIEMTEKLIGIPKNSMLRLGDCGDIAGNDYAMLNCQQGFSVRDTSGSNNACFPIFDDDGNILKGVEGTVFLINKAKILPTLCLESAVESEYKKEYSLIEKAINDGRWKQLQEYNTIFNDVFNCYDGINNVFDYESGSIHIPLYEWELIDDDHPLKQFWNTKNDNALSYSLYDNNYILLRGSKTYYYFLANRISEFDEEKNVEKDITNKDNVVNWLNNYASFFEEAIEAINACNGFIDVNSKKMVLGILDNIRNVTLILINSRLKRDYKNNKSVILNLELLPDNNLIKKNYEILFKIHKFMISLCLTKDFNINKNELINLLVQLRVLLENEFSEIQQKEDMDYSKVFRAYREIDNFAENFITVSLVDKKHNSNSFGMCGLSYGGIELPIIYKVINARVTDVLLLQFSKEISNYKNKHSVEIRNFNIEDYGAIVKIGFNPNKKYIIADDNLLTAKSMQLAMNTFYDLNAAVQGALVVRYPSINRVSQMFMENHGAANYNYFFDYVQGLCFPSPYSFRDEHNGDPYLDSLGVFDVNRQKILECLYKNHDYGKLSEVARVKKIEKR